MLRGPDSLEALPPGAHGEVVVGGHQVMRGYRRAPEEAASAGADGWFRTGDAGSFGEDGVL
ncbi:AMP-binding protein [Nocardiopsis quinghaiensis]|uniref:AMP-binding protein n=1 Tax=Nocardiopsis quinghaiensis TaxID=464995 RepID=UPI001238978F|nr:AMP-binding protein [Nocardiopsis quinghaiensis]